VTAQQLFQVSAPAFSVEGGGRRMAQKRFGNSFREALWETFDKKCFHCGGELLLLDMQVDHIVPEHFHFGEEDKRKSVLAEIGLSETFDIQGNENLAPSCVRCNSQKSGSILVGQATALALTRIKGKLPKLTENLKKKREDRSLEYFLRGVARSLDKGVFTPEELVRQVQKLVDNAQRDRDPNLTNFEVGRIWARAKPLGFTEHARRSMEEGRYLNSDLFEVLFESLMHGKATAVRVAGQSNQYLIEGPDNLRVMFSIFDSTVVILSVFRDDD
jgi:5-methylcytosine-specific restriction endonuclease McrA